MEASKGSESHWFLLDPYLLGFLHVLCPIPKPFSVMPLTPGCWLTSPDHITQVLLPSASSGFCSGDAAAGDGWAAGRSINHAHSLPAELYSQHSECGSHVARPCKRGPPSWHHCFLSCLLCGGKIFPLEMSSLAPIFDVWPQTGFKPHLSVSPLCFISEQAHKNAWMLPPFGTGWRFKLCKPLPMHGISHSSPTPEPNRNWGQSLLLTLKPFGPVERPTQLTTRTSVMWIINPFIPCVCMCVRSSDSTPKPDLGGNPSCFCQETEAPQMLT